MNIPNVLEISKWEGELCKRGDPRLEGATHLYIWVFEYSKFLGWSLEIWFGKLEFIQEENAVLQSKIGSAR